MIETKTKITSPNGLHMRPCGMIVDLASTFKSRINIIKDGTKADAKSIMELTMLAALADEELTIAAKGEDEQEAIIALEELISSDFN